MPLAITFTVPGKPQPKQRARKGKDWRGNVVWYTPAETVRYESAVRLAAWAAIVRLKDAWPMGARYSITVDAYFPDARSRDWDNVTKSVCDGMQKCAYRNDTQVAKFGGEKFIDRANPRTVVRLEVIE